MAIFSGGFRQSLLVFLLFLSACSQTITDSLIVVNEDYLSDSFRENLVKLIYSKAREFRGECKLLNQSRQYHVCNIRVDGQTLEFGVGYFSKGYYAIFIGSTVVHGIPPKKSKAVAGGYLPDIHISLERWAISILPTDAIVSARRYYIGYDRSEEIANP